MVKNKDGSITLDMNARLAGINTNTENQEFITEEQFKDALKGFKLFESLELLTLI